MARQVVDPVTRVGGHLRLEVEIADGAVRNAWSSGTMFRGLEVILQGRDPRDAWFFAQRICGTCTGTHALASVRAVENALGVRIPPNARLLRNILAGAALVQSHATRFYQQHVLDWVDPTAALEANPAAAAKLARSISDWPNSSTTHFQEVQARLAKAMASGQPGLLGNGYWGHPAYRLPPEAALMVMGHVLDSYDWQRRVARLHALLGGKDPHPQTWVVGGMTLAPPWGGPVRAIEGEHPRLPERQSPIPLSDQGLEDVGQLLADTRDFVDLVYVPDALAIAGFYEDWVGIGVGLGSFLSFGEFPATDLRGSPLILPRGRILHGDLSRIGQVDEAAVAETVAHSWYAYDTGDSEYLHPTGGQTNQRYDGPPLPYASLEGSAKYSWIKAPRYAEEPQEVGPLARMMVGYAESREVIKPIIDDFMTRLGVDIDAFVGTLGRMVARAIEGRVVAGRLEPWFVELRENLAHGDLAIADITRWDPSSWPAEAAGVSLGETPRGALGHWVTVKDGTIRSYQIVDATTWNASPRDDKKLRGAIEEALLGTPVADPARPVEILRTVNSFDPCAACAVHARGSGAGGSIGIRVAGGGDR